MNALGERAFAKINLCLFLGGTRRDGRHELVTLFESVDLSDDLVITAVPEAGFDEVICDGVAGPNLVADALSGLRRAGWSAAAVRVLIHKRIPVAAGMGGGSADAAAMLRCAPRLAPVPAATLAEIAAGLGADVPAQLNPGVSVGTGAGDVVLAVPELPSHSVLVLPQPFGLATPDVYREADRLGLPRRADEIAARHAELRSALRPREAGAPPLPGHLIVNDLQPAALSLRPEIGEALGLGLDLGADAAIVCGSGPTSVAIFWGPGSARRARSAARRAQARYPGAVAADPVVGGVSAPAPND